MTDVKSRSDLQVEIKTKINNCCTLRTSALLCILPAIYYSESLRTKTCWRGCEDWNLLTSSLDERRRQRQVACILWGTLISRKKYSVNSNQPTRFSRNLMGIAIGRSEGWAPAPRRLLFKRREHVWSVAPCCALDMDQDAARLSVVSRGQAVLCGA